MTANSLKKAKPVIVVIPKILLKRIDRVAKRIGLNRSALLRYAVEQYIEREHPNG